MAETNNSKLAREYVLEVEEHYQERNDIMERNLSFLYGKQHTSKEEEDAKAQKRKLITMNIIKPMVKVMSGVMWQSGLQPRALPQEDGDQRTAEINTDLLMWVSQRNRRSLLNSQVFMSGVTCDMGCYFLEMDYNDDLVDGSIRMGVENPKCVKPDPEFEQYDLSDAQYIVRERYMNEMQIKNTFGESARRLQFSDLDSEREDSVLKSSFGSRKHPRYRIGDSWYRVNEKRKVLVHLTTRDTFMANNKGEINTPNGLRDAEEIAARDPSNFVIHERDFPIIYNTVVIGSQELRHKITPFDDHFYTATRFPFFLYLPMFLFGRSSGMVGDTLDVQREKNQRRSQLMLLVDQAANTGWYYQKRVIDDPRKLQRLGSTPGVTIPLNPGAIWGQNIGRIAPNAVPTYVGEMEARAEQDIKTVTGINADMLGYQESTASGRAIALRQQQGMTIMQPDMQPFIETNTLLDNFTLRVIQAKFTSPKTVRIVGREKAIVINQDIVDPETGEVYQNNPSNGNYDVIIEEIPSSPSQRMVNYESLTQMFQLFGPTFIPPSHCIDASDVPGKEKLVDRARQLENSELAQAQAAGAEAEMAMQQMAQASGGGGPNQGAPPSAPPAPPAPPMGMSEMNSMAPPASQMGSTQADRNTRPDGRSM